MPWAPLFAEKTGTGPEAGATVPTDCAAEPTGFSCGPEISNNPFRFQNHLPQHFQTKFRVKTKIK